jgi:DNA topoisomerase-1
MHINFIGKKGMVNECVVNNPILINEFNSILQHKKDEDFIFTYKIGKEEKVITSIDVNNWLKRYNPEFTTKYFRTYDANILLLNFIHSAHNDTEFKPIQLAISKRKKNIVNALKSVSTQVNNTASICKKSYVHPKLIEMYLEHPKKYETMFINGDSSRLNFIKFLQKLYPKK